MVEPLLAASFTLGGAAIGAGIVARLTSRRPDETYIEPRPEPPDWVNDAHHHRRPRRGGWRQDCTSG